MIITMKFGEILPSGIEGQMDDRQTVIIGSQKLTLSLWLRWAKNKDNFYLFYLFFRLPQCKNSVLVMVL